MCREEATSRSKNTGLTQQHQSYYITQNALRQIPAKSPLVRLLRHAGSCSTYLCNSAVNSAERASFYPDFRKAAVGPVLRPQNGVALDHGISIVIALFTEPRNSPIQTWTGSYYEVSLESRYLHGLFPQSLGPRCLLPEEEGNIVQRWPGCIKIVLKKRLQVTSPPSVGNGDSWIYIMSEGGECCGWSGSVCPVKLTACSHRLTWNQVYCGPGGTKKTLKGLERLIISLA